VWGVANSLGPWLGGTLLRSGDLVLPLIIGGVAYALGGLVFGLSFRPPASTSSQRADNQPAMPAV
jgi:hypothetical protein